MDRNTAIEKFKEIYGDKYDYSKIGNITSTSDKIIIVCPIHGKFVKTVNNHLHHQGCPKCKIDERIKNGYNSFIKDARRIHGDKYDYSKIEYINNHTKVCIICPKHGEFWQEPSTHISQKCGCPKCANKNKTLEEIICKCKKIHGDKYDYSLVDSANMSKKQRIKCNNCGRFFEIDLNSHINTKRGCKYCSHRSYAYTTEEFIKKAKKIHGNKYDYSKVNYINKKTPVIIICPTHGEFWKTPEHFLRGQGCNKCSNKLFKLNKEIFIERSNKIHNSKYDYSKVEYKTVEDKVRIICPTHGEFWQTPHSHMSGVGCPKCHEENNINESRLFDIVKEKYGDEVISQYKADWLSGQTIDIYIPSKKIGIEYQGIQHFKPVKYFGGVKKYEYTVTKDKEKFNKCKNNGIKLLYFSKEKELPNEYLDIIYNNNDDLLKEIENYGT
jgi:hypothetical protein